MRGGPWLAVVEALMVKKLLESQAFHAIIRKAHKSVHQLRHGVHPSEMGGTKIDNPNGPGFLTHFIDEVKGQAFSGKAPVQKTPTTTSRPMYRAQDPKPSGAPQDASNQGGFLSDFMSEMKDQLRGGNKR